VPLVVLKESFPLVCSELLLGSSSGVLKSTDLLVDLDSVADCAFGLVEHMGEMSSREAETVVRIQAEIGSVDMRVLPRCSIFQETLSRCQGVTTEGRAFDRISQSK
jgi:hypothetical protein